MSTEYKPLFNRTYLKILLVGCVLAIIWLSSMGKPEVHPQGKVSEQPLYWLEVSDTDPQTGLPDQLQVILPTESVFSSGEQDRQQWRALILRERLLQHLGNQYRFEVQPGDDYLSFTLFSNEQQLPDLASLMEALSAPVDAGLWQAQLKQVEARRYLNQRKPEQQLLTHLGNQLGPKGPLALNWQQLFNQPRYLLAGGDAEARASQLAEQIPAWRNSTSSRSPEPLHSASTTLEIGSTDALLLLASPVPERGKPGFMRQQLIASTSLLALERFPPASNAHFRLQWKSLEHGGYQAVIFFSPLPLNEAQLQAFRDKITPELVDEARPELKQRFQNANATPRWQFNALQRIARYQMPMDALERFLAEVDALDSEEIAHAARQRFNPQQQFSLRIDNQP